MDRLSTAIMTDGQVWQYSLHGLHLSPIWILSSSAYSGPLETLVYEAPIDNEEQLHRTVDACQTIRDNPRISLHGCGGPWRDLPKRVLNLMEDFWALIINELFQL
jgi:hypothetical protein